MAYIGNQKSTATTLSSKTLDTMTGDGSDTTLTLTSTPSSVNNVAVYLNGIMQRPTVNYTLSGNVVTFTTAPANGVVVIALSGGGEHIGSPSAGSVDSDKLPIGAITDAKIATGVATTKLSGTLPALNANAVTNLTSANITGTFPAISGAALTGVPGAIDTENASDPVVTTNPSGGVGHLWLNTTSGELYACTDATAGANVWTNVGTGTGDIQAWNQFQSTNYGYIVGGGAPATNVMDRWSFASDGNATDWGDLAVTSQGLHGHNSETHGYAAKNQAQIIYKKAFASGVTSGMPASGATMITLPGLGPFGDCDSDTHGHRIGGGSNNANMDCVEKFPFATDSNSTDHGNLGTARSALSGHQSSTHGYGAGGYTGSYVPSTVIDKFAFASNTTGTNIANITQVGECHGGTSSETHGYTTGGNLGAPSYSYKTYMEKWSYASENNATDAGDLLFGLGSCGGSDSSTYGYIAAGGPGNHAGEYDDIGKHSFASDGNCTNIGNLTVARRDVCGLNS